MLTWWSLAVLAFPALNNIQKMFAILSPSFVTFLLLKVSGIPLLEKAANAKYGHLSDYALYKSRTPLLFPFHFSNRWKHIDADKF